MHSEDTSNHSAHTVAPSQDHYLASPPFDGSSSVLPDPGVTSGRQRGVSWGAWSLQLDHLDLNLDLPLLHVWSWIHCLPFLYLGFHVCKIGMIELIELIFVNYAEQRLVHNKWLTCIPLITELLPWNNCSAFRKIPSAWTIHMTLVDCFPLFEGYKKILTVQEWEIRIKTLQKITIALSFYLGIWSLYILPSIYNWKLRNLIGTP